MFDVEPLQLFQGRRRRIAVCEDNTLIQHESTEGADGQRNPKCPGYGFWLRRAKGPTLKPERAGGELAVAGWQVEGEQAQEIVSEDGHGKVEIDLDDQGGGEAVEVEEGELLGNGLLDEPAAGVAAQEGGEAGVEIVGE